MLFTKFLRKSPGLFNELTKVLSIMNKGGKFLKKLWCCVGGEYYKIIWFYQLSWPP